METAVNRFVSLLVVVILATTLALEVSAKSKSKKRDQDPYADYVWPPPPNQARIKLDQVISGRADVEARSKLKRTLMGISPQSPYERLVQPFAVAFDSQGRILVTDTGNAALIRFDRENRRMDVIGTLGSVRLKAPIGLHVGPDDLVYVADVGLHQVVAFDADGKPVAVYGQQRELFNPTDAALSPDGTRLYVADSKAHRIVVFDVATATLAFSFGKQGEGDGEFAWPTSLTFSGDGDLYVVDQINARIQVFDQQGEYLDQFGTRGWGYGNFARPKDIAIDEVGFVYVTDNAFNNLQLFDSDFTLLTFIGTQGKGPGQFYGASGVDVRNDEFAVVDQLGHRVQLFRFITPKDE